MAGELKELTKAELIKKAAKLKIRATPSMTKDEIIRELRKAEPAPSKAVLTPVKAKVTKKAAAPSKEKAVKAATAPAKAPAKPAPAKAKAASLEKKSAARAKPAVIKSAAPKAVVEERKPLRVVAVPPAEKTKAKSAVMAPEAKTEKKAVAAAIKKAEAPAPVAQITEPVGMADITKAGKRPARSRIPASPPPLNAGKEPSKAPAVSPRSPVSPAANNGKRSWDIKIDEKKFFIADEKYDYPAAKAPGLPESYGDMRLIALARDPYKLYVYWELDGKGVERARAALGRDWPELRWVMRVFDVTELEFNGSNERRHFNVDVDPHLGSVYMDVDRADCEYVLSLGLLDQSGRFEPVVTSNRVRTPRAEPSSRTDADWGVPEGLFARIYGISGGYAAAAGSLESSLLSLPFGEVSSGAVSSFGAVSSLAVSSFGVSSFGASEQMARRKERKFFFWLDCELIVYGGTEPDATVHMMGKKINLRPDGTFTARFHLPDGVHDIPVTAQSSDGVEKREISPTATRSTRRKDEFLIPEEEWLKK